MDGGETLMTGGYCMDMSTILRAYPSGRAREWGVLHVVGKGENASAYACLFDRVMA